MHPFIEHLKDRARATRRRIVFPEGDDERVVAAARMLRQDRVVEPLLISKNSCSGIETIRPADSPRLSDCTAYYCLRRASKGVTEEEARSIACRPMGST